MHPTMPINVKLQCPHLLLRELWRLRGQDCGDGGVQRRSQWPKAGLTFGVEFYYSLPNRLDQRQLRLAGQPVAQLFGTCAGNIQLAVCQRPLRCGMNAIASSCAFPLLRHLPERPAGLGEEGFEGTAKAVGRDMLTPVEVIT